MKNFKVIDNSVDILELITEVNSHPEHWNIYSPVTQHNYNRNARSNTDLISLRKSVKGEHRYIENSEEIVSTELLKFYPKIYNWITDKFHESSIGRISIVKLRPGCKVDLHVDYGKYFLNRDRYHLCLQGKYLYTVGDESLEINPGTFFYFNNKIRHGSVNVGDVDRITVIFDIKPSVAQSG
jgi:quercetin dioxygenase-like cupin family protein